MLNPTTNRACSSSSCEILNITGLSSSPATNPYAHFSRHHASSPHHDLSSSAPKDTPHSSSHPSHNPDRDSPARVPSGVGHFMSSLGASSHSPAPGSYMGTSPMAMVGGFFRRGGGGNLHGGGAGVIAAAGSPMMYSSSPSARVRVHASAS